MRLNPRFLALAGCVAALVATAPASAAPGTFNHGCPTAFTAYTSVDEFIAAHPEYSEFRDLIGSGFGAGGGCIHMLPDANSRLQRESGGLPPILVFALP